MVAEEIDEDSGEEEKAIGTVGIFREQTGQWRATGFARDGKSLDMLAKLYPRGQVIIREEFACAVQGNQRAEFGMHRTTMIAFQGILDDYFPVGMDIIADGLPNFEITDMKALIGSDITEALDPGIIQLVFKGLRIISQVETHRPFPDV